MLGGSLVRLQNAVMYLLYICYVFNILTYMDGINQAGLIRFAGNVHAFGFAHSALPKRIELSIQNLYCIPTYLEIVINDILKRYTYY